MTDIPIFAQPTPEWFHRAACRDLGPALFFAEKNATANRDVAQAKLVCRACPVRLACLDYALDNNEISGVYGGTTGKERRGLRKRRRAA